MTVHVDHALLKVHCRLRAISGPVACGAALLILVAATMLIATPLIAAPASNAPHFASDDELIGRVVELMDRRLALMPEVAAYKYARHQSVSDLAREKIVIDQSVADARRLNLDADAARVFFAIQIDLAKALEETAIAGWQAGGTEPPPARDLVKQIRPELDSVGKELLPAVYRASSALTSAPLAALRVRLDRLQRYPGITADQLSRLAYSLASLRLVASPNEATITQVGVLRVGTTGDYAPFSDDRGSADGVLRGIDIDLTQSLGKSWGISVIYIRTTWPTLMADLAAHRFDLAASGISITPERSRAGSFSAPYLFDGKMPIARRENAARFSSLEQIDRPGVRVVVNPGGTNESFAREHIRHAAILVHADNRTIFEELLAGRADVMITDATEVRLECRLHPELAATMSAPLTRSAKAILLPPGSDITARVNAWLSARLATGAI